MRDRQGGLALGYRKGKSGGTWYGRLNQAFRVLVLKRGIVRKCIATFNNRAYPIILIFLVVSLLLRAKTMMGVLKTIVVLGAVLSVWIAYKVATAGEFLICALALIWPGVALYGWVTNDFGSQHTQLRM